MDSITAYPWRIDGDGLTVMVRLTPRGGRDSIDGIGTLADGSIVLLARVRPAPEDGAANTALIKLLAKTVGIPGSDVRIASGHTSRLKKLHLAGESRSIETQLINTVAKA